MTYIKKHTQLILSLVLSLVWIILITFSTGIYFETNDDRLFAEIFSGAMTGSPEYRSYYIHPLLGLLPTLLYRFTTALPWYGLLLILFQWICHASFTYQILMGMRKNHNKLFFLALLMAYYGICFTFIARIQFTSTAALLAITGYLCLLVFFAEHSLYEWKTFLGQNILHTKAVLLFLLLQVFSYLLRSDSMLMIQPYGMAVLGTLFLVFSLRHSTNRPWKQAALCYGKFLFAVLCILVVGIGTHALFHHDEGWREYEKINQGVTEITDYSSIPTYQEVAPILQKYQVSEKQYMAFFQYAMIEENLSGDCLLEIAEYAREMQPSTTGSHLLSAIRESYGNPEYYGIGRLLLILWGICFLTVVLSKNLMLLLPMTGLLAARTVIWGYLIYRGRTPFRVIYPLWVAEILLLAILLLYAYHPKIRCVFYLTLCLGSLWILQKEYSFINAQNATEKIYNSGYVDLISYCDSHPENHYFLDAGTLLYYRGSAFTATPFHPRNSLITGCWYSGAPVLYERIAEYAPVGRDIYLIVSPDLIHQKEAVLTYFEEWRSAEAVLTDTFSVSNGGIYEVYLFSS